MSKIKFTGYVDCACRDCFDTAIGTAGEALCSHCEEAGCECGAGECQREDAYGMDDQQDDMPRGMAGQVCPDEIES